MQPLRTFFHFGLRLWRGEESFIVLDSALPRMAVFSPLLIRGGAVRLSVLCLNYAICGLQEF
jgi:hypothetical protein